MLRNHALSNIGSLGSVVNNFVTPLVTLVSVVLIASAYFSAVGQFAFA